MRDGEEANGSEQQLNSSLKYFASINCAAVGLKAGSAAAVAAAQTAAAAVAAAATAAAAAAAHTAY